MSKTHRLAAFRLAHIFLITKQEEVLFRWMSLFPSEFIFSSKYEETDVFFLRNLTFNEPLQIDYRNGKILLGKKIKYEHPTNCFSRWTKQLFRSKSISGSVAVTFHFFENLAIRPFGFICRLVNTVIFITVWTTSPLQRAEYFF